MIRQVNRVLTYIYHALSASSTSTDTLINMRSMSINRLIVAVCIISYLALSEMARKVQVAEYATTAFYLSVAALIFLNLHGWPRRRIVGRFSTLVLDVGMLSIANVAFGANVALFYPLYLWIIVGNAFRFGIPYLVAATVMSAMGFGTVVVMSPFWSTIPILASGLLSGLIVVPIYFGFLLLRERAKNEQLDLANKSKAFILSTIGHELRAPLGVVVALHDALQGTPLSRKQQTMVRTAGVAAKTTMSELDDLLDVARIRAGRMTVDPTTFQLLDLITELVELTRIVAATSSVQIAFHFVADVPLVVIADRRHFRKILLALLYNAVGFTTVGFVVLTVSRIYSGQPTTYLNFEVTDTGIGIPADMQAKIFEAYAQADTRTLADHRGSGLELAVAHHLVDLLDGAITVRSRAGEGSTFEVELPVGVPPVSAPGQSELAGYAVVIFSGNQKEAEQFASRLRKLRATTFILDQVDRLDAILEKAAEDADRIVLVLDGRSVDALSLVQALHQDLALRAVPLILLRQVAGWLPLTLRQAFVSAVAMDLTDIETVAALQTAARAAGVMRTDHDIDTDQKGGLGEFPVRDTMSQPSRRLYVLVADGHRTTQILVSRMLEAAGHVATVVGDGEQVLSAIGVQNFDVVLVDLDLPEINGFDVAKMIRMAGYHDLPIIGLASDAAVEVAQSCASASMQSYFVKPVNNSQLQEVLRQIAKPPTMDGRAVELPSLAEQKDQVPGVTNITSHPQFRPGMGAPLEEDALQDVAALGDRAFMETFVQAFSADTAAISRFLSAAARSGDETLWRSQLKALRTQAQVVGARRLETLCEFGSEVEAERLASDGKALADRLSFEVVRVREALEQMS